MKRATDTKTFLCLMIASLVGLLPPLAPADARAATPRDTADYPADPRPAVAEFFRLIRAGDAEAAWKCWNPAVRQGDDKEYEQTQVRNAIAEWIAQFRLDEALKSKLPQLYEKMQEAAALAPVPAQIAEKATFTTFRRLAIVRWNDDEDAALPLELDTNAKPPRWLISLSHYRETTRASVGDAFRTTDLSAQVLGDVTKQVLDGKVKTPEELATVQLDALSARLKKMPTPKEK